jgi:hypothetical protein
MGRCGRKKKERKACRPGSLRAELEERERERERGKGFVFFLEKNFFQIHFSIIQTPIKQNPCI